MLSCCGGGKARAPAGPSLKVLAGPDAGRTFDITIEKQTIGRQSGAAILLHDPQSLWRVSREHAFVWAENGRVLIADNQSTHGVLINGQKIGGAAELRDGDKLLLGKVELQYRAPSPEWWKGVAAATPPPVVETGEAAEAAERRTELKPRKRPAAESQPPPEGDRRTVVKPKRGE